MASVTEMARKYAEFTGLPISQSKRIWSDVCKFIYESLENGESLTFTGVGQMSVKQKPARNYNNPRTGEPMVVDAHYAPVMKWSTSIRRDIKEKIQTI